MMDWIWIRFESKTTSSHSLSEPLSADIGVSVSVYE